MTRTATAKRRVQLRTVDDTAVLRRNDLQCIAAHADYRRDDYIFPRQQSLELRQMEWESRLKPIKPWVPNFAANLAFAIFA